MGFFNKILGHKNSPSVAAPEINPCTRAIVTEMRKDRSFNEEAFAKSIELAKKSGLLSAFGAINESSMSAGFSSIKDNRNYISTEIPAASSRLAMATAKHLLKAVKNNDKIELQSYLFSEIDKNNGEIKEIEDSNNVILAAKQKGLLSKEDIKKLSKANEEIAETFNKVDGGSAEYSKDVSRVARKRYEKFQQSINSLHVELENGIQNATPETLDKVISDTCKKTTDKLMAMENSTHQILADPNISKSEKKIFLERMRHLSLGAMNGNSIAQELSKAGIDQNIINSALQSNFELSQLEQYHADENNKEKLFAKELEESPDLLSFASSENLAAEDSRKMLDSMAGKITPAVNLANQENQALQTDNSLVKLIIKYKNQNGIPVREIEKLLSILPDDEREDALHNLGIKKEGEEETNGTDWGGIAGSTLNYVANKYSPGKQLAKSDPGFGIGSIIPGLISPGVGAAKGIYSWATKTGSHISADQLLKGLQNSRASTSVDVDYVKEMVNIENESDKNEKEASAELKKLKDRISNSDYVKNQDNLINNAQKEMLKMSENYQKFTEEQELLMQDFSNKFKNHLSGSGALSGSGLNSFLASEKGQVLVDRGIVGKNASLRDNLDSLSKATIANHVVDHEKKMFYDDMMDSARRRHFVDDDSIRHNQQMSSVMRNQMDDLKAYIQGEYDDHRNIFDKNGADISSRKNMISQSRIEKVTQSQGFLENLKKTFAATGDVAAQKNAVSQYYKSVKNSLGENYEKRIASKDLAQVFSAMENIELFAPEVQKEMLNIKEKYDSSLIKMMQEAQSHMIGDDSIVTATIISEDINKVLDKFKNSSSGIYKDMASKEAFMLSRQKYQASVLEESAEISDSVSKNARESESDIEESYQKHLHDQDIEKLHIPQKEKLESIPKQNLKIESHGKEGPIEITMPPNGSQPTKIPTEETKAEEKAKATAAIEQEVQFGGSSHPSVKGIS